MKRLLSLAAALTFAGLATAQTMVEINDGLRYHAMSENGKYMLNVSQGYIGIYDTETGEYKECSDPMTAYDLGAGNMVTNDGILVGCMDGEPAVYDITNNTWTRLGMEEEDKDMYAMANAITPSHSHIIGYVTTGNDFGKLGIKPVIWTLKDDGTYGGYEELPYPEKDFTGTAPQYILPNCISADGNTIAAQLVMQDNDCLPMTYRRAQDGTWTYHVYDEGLCEPGLEFPEYPESQPVKPDAYAYMTEDETAAYRQDSIEYQDSIKAYRSGQSTVIPTYYPRPQDYMADGARAEYDNAMALYNEEAIEYSENLMAFREFYSDNVKSNFYGQNAVWLSTNGKYYSTTGRKNHITGDAALITVDGTELHDYEDGLYAQCVTNDGDLFVSDNVTAYVYPAGSTERVTLVEWLRMKGEGKAADWLSGINTGVAICSGDGRVISGHYGSATSLEGVNSWIIKLDGIPTGIDEITDDADPAAPVKVYDLQGRLIKECPRAEATDGLTKGVYIIGNKKVAVK